MQDDREAKAAAKKALKMEKYAEKIEAAKREQEAEEKRKAEEAEKERIKAENEAEQKKAKKAAVNAAKKQRKVFRQLAKGTSQIVIQFCRFILICSLSLKVIVA